MEELKTLATKYLDMVGEGDGHCGTPERDKERTDIHNALINGMLDNGLVHFPPNRTFVRWLARYLVNGHIKYPGETTKVMLMRRGSGELVNVPPYSEEEEPLVFRLYKPVIVTIRGWDEEGNNGLPARSDRSG